MKSRNGSRLGKSLRVRPELKKTPLGEAVTTGPQSRRLFVRNETDESLTNEAIADLSEPLFPDRAVR